MANIILNFHFDYLTTSLIIAPISPLFDRDNKICSKCSSVGGNLVFCTMRSSISTKKNLATDEHQHYSPKPRIFSPAGGNLVFCTMRSGNFQVCRSSLQAASDRIFSKLLGKSSIVSRASRFWDSLDFGSSLCTREVSITCSCNPSSGLAAPFRGSGQAAWSVGLASCKQESFFLFLLFHIVKLQSLTKCLKSALYNLNLMLSK